MAQTGAVIHVVMAKTLTDDFLKKIGFFIGTFRTAKPGNRPPPIFRLERIQTICCAATRAARVTSSGRVSAAGADAVGSPV